MTAGPISVTYEISESAFMAASNQLWAHRAIGRTGNMVVAGTILACAAVLIWQGVPGIWPWLLLAGVGVFLLLDLLRDRNWRRYYQTTPKYRGPITAIFSKDGVGVRSGEADNDLPWNHFRHFVITKNYLFLLVDQRTFPIIPLAAFTDAQARAQAEALIARKLKRLKARLF